MIEDIEKTARLKNRIAYLENKNLIFRTALTNYRDKLGSIFCCGYSELMENIVEEIDEILKD